MPDDFGIVIVAVVENTCRTMAEQLFIGEQLLVNLQTRHKTNAVVGLLRSLFTGYITSLPAGLFVMGFGIKRFDHIVLSFAETVLKPVKVADFLLGITIN